MVEGSRSEGDRAREKRKDYRNATILQAAIIVVALTLEDALQLVGLTEVSRPAWLFLQLSSAAYLFLLWDMLRNFVDHAGLIRGVLVTLIATYLALLGTNLFYYLEGIHLPAVRLACHVILVTIELLVIGHAVSDLFRSPRNTVDKLWGSACIYFMSGFLFASVYHIIHMHVPLAFGKAVEGGHASLFESLYLSLNVLVGLDNAYPGAIRIVRNLMVIQALWGQLYLVLLIGRVLMPPDGELA